MSEENTVPEWAKTTLPETLHDIPFLKDAADEATFKQRIVDAGQWMGNSLRKPGPDASAEDIAAFQAKVIEVAPGLMPSPNLEDPDTMKTVFAKLGRPDNADAYKVPEGVEVEGELLGQLKSLAFKANMTQQQFDAYTATITESSKTQLNQQTLQHEQGLATLKGEWGAAYDENVGQIMALLKTNSTTPPGMVEQLEGGNLPADQVRFLHSLAESVSNEDGQFHSQGGRQNAVMLSRSEASARADEVTARMVDRTKPPTASEMEVLQKKALAYEMMAGGERPPAELMGFISS